MALAAVVAAALTLSGSERLAAAQSEPQTVGDVTGFAASVEGQPNGSVHLAWNAADNAQVYFVVYIKSTDLVAGNYGSVQMRPFNGTEGMIDGLDGGVPYSFTVTGMRWNWINYGTVWGSFAVWQHATPPGTATSPASGDTQSEPQTVGDVTGFAASVEGQPNGSVHLAWNAADNAQVYFVVYIKSTDLVAGNYGSVQMRPFNGTEGMIDGLDGGVPYSFTVTGMRWNWINYGTVWGSFAVWQHATPSGVAALPSIAFSDLENGAWLEQNKPALANQLKALLWVADGVDGSEHGTAEDLIAAALWFPNVFSSLMQMSWLGDGVTNAEAIAIRYIRATAFYDSKSPGTDLAGTMLQKSWAQDAITADEAEIIRRLFFIVWYDTDSPPPSQVITEVNVAASRILGMPFLDLYRNLGDAIFRQGFSSLYQMRQVLNEYLWPTPRGIAPPDSGPVDSSLPAIDGRIEEAFVAFYQDGQEEVGSPVTRFSAAGVGDRWLFVYLGFTFPSTAGPKVQPLEYVQYYEDGFAFGQRERVHTFEPSWTGARSGTSVGFPPGRKWVTGRYWVYVYDGDRKVSEVTYEVVP